MRIPLFQVDAFTSTLFHGNPAAICPLSSWLPDAVLQGIAAENNLAETAFFVSEDDGVRLRWFTPTVEVNLCGHATLASAWVILNRLERERSAVRFHTRSGLLIVRQCGDELEMDFPSTPPRPVEACDGLLDGLGGEPLEVLGGPQYLVVYPDEAAVRSLRPDMARLLHLDRHGAIVTALGDQVDFVSRFFAPQLGVPEDPVTGSAHCTLAPFWAARLGRTQLRARQISARGGDLTCEVAGDRVLLRGRCAPYMEGIIELPDHLANA